MTAPSRIRLLVADDHPLFRDGLVRQIRGRPEFELIGEAADGPSALKAIRELRPDIAVLDIKMPKLDGLRVAAAVARDELPTRIVMLSAYVEGPLVFRALAAGARAFLSKEADRREVCDTIAAVARGDVVLPPNLHSGLAQQIRTQAQTYQATLTARERAVLTLIASGATAPEIARRLNLGTGTIKTHQKNLYEKLGVNDRAAAVAEAMRRGLVE